MTRRARLTLTALTWWLGSSCAVVGPSPTATTAAEGGGQGRSHVAEAPTGSRGTEAVAPSGDLSTPTADRGYRWLRPLRPFEEVRGLWVVRTTLTAPDRIRTMVEQAAAAGFNTLVVQVRGRGDAFYLSDLEPRAQAIRAPSDFDPLAMVVEEAHRRGLAVHAWVNMHLVWGPTQPPRDRGHIVNRHPDWLAVPRSLARELAATDPHDPRYLDALRRYASRNGDRIEGIYTSPSHPDVRTHLHAVWLDLLRRYPLDGIHFDYMRYASPDFDFSPGSLRRFAAWLHTRAPSPGTRAHSRAVTDAPGPLPPPDAPLEDLLELTDRHPEAWAEWQREQITRLVRRIHRDVKARRPEVVVSAAVFPDPEDAYHARYQDWRGWLREGILDIVVPMAYTSSDPEFTRRISEARAVAGSRERAWAGVGAYLNTLEGTISKIDRARAADVGGFLLFSYDWARDAATGEDPEPFLERIGRERLGGR